MPTLFFPSSFPSFPSFPSFTLLFLLFLLYDQRIPISYALVIFHSSGGRRGVPPVVFFCYGRQAELADADTEGKGKFWKGGQHAEGQRLLR